MILFSFAAVLGSARNRDWRSTEWELQGKSDRVCAPWLKHALLYCFREQARLACFRLSAVEWERKKGEQDFFSLVFARPQLPRTWNKLRQDEPNLVQCLATRAGKMALSWRRSFLRVYHVYRPRFRLGPWTHKKTWNLSLVNNLYKLTDASSSNDEWQRVLNKIWAGLIN